MLEGADAGSLILVGVDGSERSLRAGAFVAGLVRERGARIVCLFVHAQRAPSSAAAVELALVEQVAREQTAADLRAEIALRSVELGLGAELIERSGDPFKEIVRVADQLRVDAVVVGASRRRGLRAASGLSSRLVRVGHWPVIVVP